MERRKEVINKADIYGVGKASKCVPWNRFEKRGSPLGGGVLRVLIRVSILLCSFYPMEKFPF